MRHLPRVALWAVLIGVAPVVSGCSSFDPDSLDIFGLNEKKKMPGERRDVFPEGVPGVSQGIPQEYLRQPNAAAPADGMQQQAAAPVAAPPPEPPKPAARPAPRPRTAARPAPRPAAAAPTAPVEAQPMQPAQQAPAANSAWPSQQQGSSQPSSSSSAWPAPQPSGTFQR